MRSVSGTLPPVDTIRRWGGAAAQQDPGHGVARVEEVVQRLLELVGGDRQVALGRARRREEGRTAEELLEEGGRDAVGPLDDGVQPGLVDLEPGAVQAEQ